MPLIVVYNPVSGARTGAKLTAETIIPLLASYNVSPDKVASTEFAGHAGTLVLSYINSLATSVRAEGITLVLVSGDGTLHEIVNALHSARAKQDGPFPSLRIVLIPGGTANALHATYFPPPSPSSSSPSSAAAAEPMLLASLLSFLSATPRLLPLTLAHTSTIPPSALQVQGSSERPKDESTASVSPSSGVISIVVTSTALHAAILHDSEALRASVPGVERYKLAAVQNTKTWHRARARLLGPVQRYDVTADALVAVTEEEPLELPGPFVYFLSTVNVDRLEPLFRIAPLQRALLPPSGAQTMDVIAVHPLRDPSLEGKSGEAEREKFSERIWSTIGEAYQDGAHIRARYEAQDGRTEGLPVVEYFRVRGWEWIPVSLPWGTSPCYN